MPEEPQITVTAKCPTCDVPVEYEAEEGDGAVVRCPSCSEEFGTYGELHQMLVDRAKQELKDSLRDQFKDHPWIKVE